MAVRVSMAHCKYIMFDNGYIRIPIIFPDCIKHSDMAAMLDSKLGKPITAGFVTLSDGKIATYGNSISLGLSSDKQEDTILIDRELNIDRD